ncbi:MAG: gamma-glutamyltransferase, partial [Candidatus Dadabacteria bacterium]|nr:gamma-glutamyltransferase [Candidatus Dadabacteria bacterium]NIS10184.1 gamma-glutamyltransferase [Candidatus Dadabacteria bacterium]NIV42575.1 gamma-glutamyltransferase [Candidatus Dadabacteria bacterium]NIX16550.1 gamma-glutamyltransferase [Candidatus Dadabacteria bacterium]NIY23096.1 gamma-glutamyltransferase [Candidatus Dadabacteria bacterium]
MKLLKLFLITIIPVVTVIYSSYSSSEPIISSNEIFQPVIAGNGMVASDNMQATEAGLAILKECGNAIDAAVTVGFTMAATYPRAGNIGGGGFMLIYLAESKEVIAIDYREKAPKAAKRDMFLDKNGNVDNEKSRHSYLAVGVLGTVAGLSLALEKYGTISLKKALRPAIKYAEDGIIVDYELQSSLNRVKDRMKNSSDAYRTFFKKDGSSYGIGENIVQKDLAWSLKQIKKHGPDAFYKGKIAKKIVSDMKENGGLITYDDLSSYKPVIRRPVHGNYRGYDIFSMPPPSSGGIHLIQMLNILEHFPISNHGHNNSKTIHIMAEAMKLAYADRSKYLGDSDFIPVPIKELTSKQYAKSLSKKINLKTATSSETIKPGNPYHNGGNDTTHFTVTDKWGNVVSNTYTINFSYGSKIMAKDTGILLNNEMDDFSAKPGVPNAYGLIGGEYNAIEPEKRMLSSMSPTIVLKDGKPLLATGSPGGSRIITTVLQIISNIIDHKMNIATATASPRFHHQWLPDVLRIEHGFSTDTLSLLKNKGHEIKLGRAMGSTQSIMKIGDYYYGHSDPRRPGGLTKG